MVKTCTQQARNLQCGEITNAYISQIGKVSYNQKL